MSGRRATYFKTVLKHVVESMNNPSGRSMHELWVETLADHFLNDNSDVTLHAEVCAILKLDEAQLVEFFENSLYSKDEFIGLYNSGLS
jgi:hypothetical protein